MKPLWIILAVLTMLILATRLWQVLHIEPGDGLRVECATPGEPCRVW